MAEISPLRRHRGHDGPQSVDGDATFVPQRCIELQPVFGRSPDRLTVAVRFNTHRQVRSQARRNSSG